MSLSARSRLYHGWWIVLASSVALSFSFAAVIVATFSLFLPHIEKEFGWSRTQISLAMSIAMATMTLSLPYVGRSVDRYGARRVVISGTLVMAAALASFQWLDGQLLFFYAIFVVLGAAGGGTLFVPYAKVVSRWFDRRRGLALALVMMGSGLGHVITPPLSGFLIAQFGWQLAYAALGAIAVTVAVPLVATLLVDSPEAYGLDAAQIAAIEGRPGAGGGHGAHGMSLASGMPSAEAFRTRTFWHLLLAFFLMAVALNGCLAHMGVLLTDRGFDTGTAALALSLYGAGTMAGRFTTGVLVDRLFAPHIGSFFFAAAAGGIVLLLFAEGRTSVAIAAFLIGAGTGAEGDLIAYLIGRYFGLRFFGELYGYGFGSFALGAMLGPISMGVGFDMLGSYDAVMGVLAALAGVAALLMLGLGRFDVPLSPLSIATATVNDSDGPEPAINNTIGRPSASISKE